MATKLVTQPWKHHVFKDASVDLYVGLERELFIDGRNAEYVLRISDGVTPGGRIIGAESGGVGVAYPVITSPINGATGIYVDADVITEGFIGVDSSGLIETHATTKWQISSVSDFSSMVMDGPEDAVNLTTFNLADVPGGLSANVTYFIRARFTAVSGVVSAYSDIVEFATKSKGDFAAITLTQLANPTLSYEHFGNSVALSADGSVMAVGAYNSNVAGVAAGSVHILKRNNANVYVETDLIVSPIPVSAGWFGRSVALNVDGTKLFIGEPGANSGASRSGKVYEYVVDGVGVYGVENTITAQTLIANGYFGTSLAITPDATKLFIGSPYATSGGVVLAGKVYIYVAGLVHDPEGDYLDYSEDAIIEPSVPGDRAYFGESVAVSADGLTLIVGEIDATVGAGIKCGRVIVLDGTSGTFLETAYMDNGLNINYHDFGQDVALSSDGNLLAISNPKATSSGISGAGVTTIYKRGVGGGYVTHMNLEHGPTAVASDFWGMGLAMSGDGKTLVIGSEGYNDISGAADIGAIDIYN